MGRTFETLRRRDAGHVTSGGQKKPGPAAAPPPSSPPPADFSFGTGEIPFIEVGEVTGESTPAPVAVTALPVPAVAASPASNGHIRFLPQHAKSVSCSESALVFLSRPESPEANQYRQVRDGLLETASKRSVRTLLLSPDRECSGDLLAVNLACSLAEMSDRSVLLIDADLKGKPLAQRFDLAPAPGWSELLLGLPVAQALQQSICPKLHVIAAGNRLVGARALTRGAALQEQLDMLAKSYDLILIRGPGSAQPAEALALAQACDAVCFLQSKLPAGTSAEPELLAAWQREGIRVLGTIVTAD